MWDRNAGLENAGLEDARLENAGPDEYGRVSEL